MTPTSPKPSGRRAAQDRTRRLRRTFLRGSLALAVELVDLSVDVIVAAGTAATQGAMGATSTIPIVVAGAGDPDRSGPVTNLARPGGNMTGTSNLASQVTGKRPQLLRETLPRISRVMILSDTSEDQASGALQESQAVGALQEAQVAADSIGGSS